MSYPKKLLYNAARRAAVTSTREAGEKYGIHPETVRAAMKRLGIPRRRTGNLDTYAPELRRYAVGLYLGGLSRDAVAAKTGIPPRYVLELSRAERKRAAIASASIEHQSAA